MATQTPDNLTSIPFDPSRWAILTTLLSMDVVMPFYDLMGIRLADPQALAALLRYLILDVRRETREDASAGPFYSAERVVNTIASTLGAQVRDHLVWWEHYVFHDSPEDHVDLYYWNSVLRECRHDAALWNRLGFPLGVRQDARRRFLESIDPKEYQRRHEQTYSKPLSDWDLHMYAINLFDDDDDEGTPSGPDTWVDPTITDYQGFCFWGWVLQRLNPTELDTLQQNANQIVRETDYLASVGELVHPDRLRVPL